MADSLKHLSDKDFDQAIASGVVLVDFYADWCGPCRMVGPIMEELSKDNGAKITIAKVDIDQAQATATKYNVTSIPTVMLFVDGEPSKTVVGVRDKKSYQALIDAAL